MIRKNFFITGQQEKFFTDHKLNFSEHVRRAIDEYIFRFNELNASASASKKEVENGSNS